MTGIKSSGADIDQDRDAASVNIIEQIGLHADKAREMVLEFDRRSGLESGCDYGKYSLEDVITMIAIHARLGYDSINLMGAIEESAVDKLIEAGYTVTPVCTKRWHSVAFSTRGYK